MKTKKIWRNLLVFALTCVMVCATAIPAFAALVVGETQKMRYKILYVDSSFNIGYDYGEEWYHDYTCAYTTGHSGYNHLIKIADIKTQSETAKSKIDNQEWEIVGYSKEASANPRIFSYEDSGTTATQTTYTIYFVAKKAAPATSTVILDANGGLYTNGLKTRALTGNVGDSVYSANGYEVPKKDGYAFVGWAATASTGTVLNQLVFGAKGTTTTYYAVWQSEKFTVVYHSQNNKDGRSVTVNMVSGKYSVVDGVDSGYLYGGTFSDADCTSAYDFANGENGMGFTPKAGETYHVWELDAKYLAPRNYLIWRIVKPGSSVVHVSELYMLFALDRLNYREAGFDVDVEESSGGGSLLSLDTNRKSIYQGDANETKIAFETIDVIRPDQTLEDYIYVRDGVIKNTGSGYVVNEPDRDPGYIVLSKLNAADFKAFSAKAGNSVSYVPYYVTVDGIRVTGNTMRTCGYRGEDIGAEYKSIDWKDKPVDSTATPIATSRLNLFSSRNGIMSSAGSFSVENGGVEENVPQKPVFGKKMNRR